MTDTMTPSAALPASPSPPSPPPPSTVAAPRWERPVLTLLLLVTAGLYLFGLDRSGYANSFYSAAVQAGSQSWKAFFFGSSDAANSITVDKPPASLWPMALAVRVFGLSSWSILAPEALMGVASVWLLFRTVRRPFGAAAGIIAGAVLALTPVAVLMFKFNNPDALLVLLMVAAVWALLRAVEDGRTRWLVLTGVLVGLGFLTKQLQVFVVVPALGLTYLLAGPPTFGRRLGQLLVGLAAVVGSAGWWVAAVTLWPASSRPYIGGSQDNSFLSLTFGYNGLGRLTGNETGSVGGGARPGGGGPSWGSTGIGRMFDSEFGGQVAWLLPAALVLGVAGLVLRGRAARTDGRRASFVVWGLWLLVTVAVFSFSQGIIHSYYTVALAPAIGALVGSGAAVLWARRTSVWGAGVLALTVGATAVWAFALLGRSPSFLPWLRWVVLGVGLVSAVVLVAAPALPRRVLAVLAGTALVTGLAGPTAYALQTSVTGHQGALPSAGPVVPGGTGFGGGPRGRRPGLAPGVPPGALLGFPGRGAFGGGRGPVGVGGAGGPAGAAGGLLNGSTPSAELAAALEVDAGAYTWVAATTGSNNASGYQLATGDPVMPIGGFNGSDPAPTLAQFQLDVTEGKIHYYIASRGFGRAQGAAGTASQISSWVAQTFTATTVGGVTLYDLTAPHG